MKKSVIIVVCVILIVSLFGCFEENEKHQISGGASNEIRVFNGFVVENEENIAFTEFLDTEFGVTYVSLTRNMDIPISELNEILKIDINEYNKIYERRHELLLPLNDLISNNSVIAGIPDSIMNAVTDSDGNIWALLISHRFNTISRIYNEKIMNELEADIPSSLEEFKDLLIKVKDADIENIIRVSEDSCAEMLYDIFANFNCRLFNNKYTIGWNDQEKLFMDYVYTDEMLYSLEYIRELRKAGLISVGLGGDNLISSAFNSDNLFTISKLNRNGLTDDYSTNSFAGSSFIMEVADENMLLYVVPKSTENASEKVNYFINTFYGDEKINKAGGRGIEGKHYSYISPEFVSRTDNPPYFPLISASWISNFYLTLNSVNKKSDYENWLKGEQVAINNNYSNGTYNLLQIDQSINLFERIAPDSGIKHDLFSKMLYKFIKEDLSISQFLEEYESETKKMGIDDYLMTLNDSKPH